MKKLMVVFLVLALVITVSGCTTEKTPKVSLTDGIVIKEFSADMDRYSNQESIPLYLEIENEGGTTASSVRAEVLGASWTTKPSIDIGSITPPDLTVKPAIPGGFYIYNPVLASYSSLPEGVESETKLTSRITYAYSNNGVVTVNVINKNEYGRRIKMNVALPTGTAVQNSRGPIHLDISTKGIDPVIATGDGGSMQDVPLRIEIKNVGAGAPVSGDEIGKLDASLTLQGLDATFTQCMGSTSYNGATVTIPLTLRHGESVTVPCLARVRSPDITDSFSIIMTTSYTYFIEQTLFVSIVGAPKSLSNPGS